MQRGAGRPPARDDPGRRGVLHPPERSKGEMKVGRKLGGVALCLVAAFMVVGLVQVGGSGIATVLAWLIAVGIPGVVGVNLLVGGGRRKRLAARKEALRRQTVESEILRLATRSGHKLTVLEVVSELAVPADEASDILDALAARDMAELQVTDHGVLVYDFPDLRHLPEKDSATGLLDG